jgi:hypothetical protein
LRGLDVLQVIGQARVRVPGGREKLEELAYIRPMLRAWHQTRDDLAATHDLEALLPITDAVEQV